MNGRPLPLTLLRACSPSLPRPPRTDPSARLGDRSYRHNDVDRHRTSGSAPAPQEPRSSDGGLRRAAHRSEQPEIGCRCSRSAAVPPDRRHGVLESAVPRHHGQPVVEVRWGRPGHSVLVCVRRIRRPADLCSCSNTSATDLCARGQLIGSWASPRDDRGLTHAKAGGT